MTDIAIPVESVAAAVATPAPEPPAASRSRRPLTVLLESAGLRAARTFTQAFLAVLTAGPVLNLNVGVLKAGATAGFAAVLTLAQRLLDDTRIPTIPVG